MIFDPSTYTYPNFTNLQSRAYGRRRARQHQQLGRRRQRSLHRGLAGTTTRSCATRSPPARPFPSPATRRWSSSSPPGNDGPEREHASARRDGEERHHGRRDRERPRLRRRRPAAACERHSAPTAPNDIVVLLEPRPDHGRAPQARPRRARHARHRRRRPDRRPRAPPARPLPCFDGTRRLRRRLGATSSRAGQQFYTASSGTSHSTPRRRGRRRPRPAALHQPGPDAAQPGHDQGVPDELGPLPHGRRARTTRCGRTPRAWASWTWVAPSTSATARPARPGARGHLHRHRPDAHVHRHHHRPGPALPRDPGLDGRARLDVGQRLHERPRPDSGGRRRHLQGQRLLGALLGRRRHRGPPQQRRERLPAGGRDRRLHRHRRPRPTSTRTACPASGGRARPGLRPRRLQRPRRRRCRTSSPAGATIAAESCGPGNGALDPGETVTRELRPSPTSAPGRRSTCMATLLPTGGVNGAERPAVVRRAWPRSAPAVARPFTFTASGTCGGTLTATLQLQDGASDLGTASFGFALGALAPGSSGTFTQQRAPSPSPRAARPRPTRRR